MRYEYTISKVPSAEQTEVISENSFKKCLKKIASKFPKTPVNIQYKNKKGNFQSVTTAVYITDHGKVKQWKV